MKTLTKILFVTAIAATFTLTARADGRDGALLSPKARQLQDSLRRGAGPETDMLDRSVKSASPKQLATKESMRRSGGREKDMIARNEILGNARGRASSSANPPTWGTTFNLAPTK
jgi:hypothetical protein